MIEIDYSTTQPMLLVHVQLHGSTCTYTCTFSIQQQCYFLPHFTEHLELVMREVYLPLISSHLPPHSGLSGDKLMDLMHRLVGAVQVTKGFW